MIPAISVRDMSYRFGDQLAVAHLDLTVQRGEVFGLLGPNGAGKTTTIRVLNTLLPLQTGTARVFGLDVRRQAMAVRRVLGYVPQQLSIEGALTDARMSPGLPGCSTCRAANVPRGWPRCSRWST